MTPIAILDSHQHAWTIGGPGQSWPGPDLPDLHRDFGLADLRAAADGVELAGTVLVQSQPDDRDTGWMLALAGGDPLVRAVVGWVDLASPDAPERIAALARHPKLKGLRPMLQAIEDSAWILRPELAPAIEAMIAHGLRFDALVQPRHLPALARFATHWPELPLVIDHGAKPFAATGDLDPWREEIAALAAFPHVHAKLSGLRTEQAPSQTADALAPYVAHLVACFGERLMWGSDWPVLLLAGDSYKDWLTDAERLAAPTDEAARRHLFHDAAARFYGL
ncbi:amidohydrolase family protein [Sphingomonas sp. PR090111-T3T-6A]|uniref:amidohydrolase family protein n=1 Tax=Sphingomonas sp. PR090111-T3T-6A TaxID=685778 RepID=UPI00035D7ECE|nr:amidohydrolase family protein [Sphingomonas sp. PR090111-T3T-6A]